MRQSRRGTPVPAPVTALQGVVASTLPGLAAAATIVVLGIGVSRRAVFRVRDGAFAVAPATNSASVHSETHVRTRWEEGGMFRSDSCGTDAHDVRSAWSSM